MLRVPYFSNGHRIQVYHKYLSFLPMLAKRQYTIECRGADGKPISKEDLFQYTNGRFLSDEKLQFSKRYVRFNVEKLCDVVANVSGSRRSPVMNIEKMEGGFSKALLLTREDGSEYIVKIPFPNAGRPMYCTASEVAVLKFIHRHTTIPVPNVLAWNSHASNAIGAEYIIMEKVAGAQVFKVWDEMGEQNRISLIKRLTQWERELCDIHFPAYGNLYLRSDLDETERIPLNSSIDPEGDFCIGPACDASWLLQPGQSAPRILCGPWRTLCDMGNSLVERSLLQVSQHPNLQLPSSLYGAIDDHRNLLNSVKEALPSIAKSTKLSNQAQPILWHTDLHMGNIFVSEDDPAIVTGIIDWQNAIVNPAFLQVRWPVFLTPPDGYQEGQVLPGLPADFENMDDDEKEIALYNKAKATWTKAYEVASFLNNRNAWRGMQVNSELKELFRRCGETWNEGILPLRETLIAITLNQKKLGLPLGNFQLHFDDEQIAKHEQEFALYEEWHEMRKFVKEMLDTDDEGWIPLERDFEEMKSRNNMLYKQVDTKLPKTLEEMKNMWPFLLDT